MGILHSFGQTQICIHGQIYNVTKIIIMCIVTIGRYDVFKLFFRLIEYFFHISRIQSHHVLESICLSISLLDIRYKSIEIFKGLFIYRYRYRNIVTN